MSAVFLTPLDIKNYLGDIQIESGKIVSARATYMNWFGKKLVSDFRENKQTSQEADHETMEFELALR